MEQQRIRRTVEGVVRTAGPHEAAIEVMVSDHGDWISAVSTIAFPERRMVTTYAETVRRGDRGSPKPEIHPLESLEGISVGPGFVRAVNAALADKEETVRGGLVDALVETARLAGQVGFLPWEEVCDLDITDPRVLRRLDLTHWPELNNGCMPYSEGIESQFGSLGIRSASRADLYGPMPGQQVRFRRSKVLRRDALGGAPRLMGVLSDDIHELEVELVLKPGTATVEAVQVRSVRSPYPGICNLPFPRASRLAGSALDRDFKARVVEAVGGPHGCVHLQDVILDLVRFGAARM